MPKLSVAIWLCAAATLVGGAVVPLNEPCTSDQFSSATCGKNAFCSELSERCQCKLGFLSGGATDCLPMTCFNQKMCNGTFGIGTTCYTPGWSGYCGCDASFKLNPRTQICVQSKSALKGSCTFDSECGLNGLCQGGHCGCAFAHVPSRWNDVNCDQLQCNTDGQCKSHFGDNTLCNQLYNVCQCSPDATLDSVTQTCVKSNIKY